MTNQRLPLPGEKPVGVWRPRRRPRRAGWQEAYGGGWRVTRRLVPLALAAGMVLLGLTAWRLTATPVTVVVNGQEVAVSTHRRTVAGAARAAGVRPGEMVYLRPAGETPLKARMVVEVAERRPVVVVADGQRIEGVTHEIDPAAIAADLGISVGPDDLARVQRSTNGLPREVRVVRPVRVVVERHPSGQRVAFSTTAPTLGRALAEAGYALYEADRVSLPLSTPLDFASAPPGGVVVVLEQATPVTVIDGGARIEARTHRSTVRAMLAEMGLGLAGADYARPDADTPVEPGQVVEVIRVREEVVSQRLPIPYETVYVPDPDLELDQQQVIQPGREGEMERRVRVRTENGVEVSRAVEGEWVARQPQAETVAYGTRIVIRSVMTPNGPRQYWRKLDVLATSYSPLTAGAKQPGDPRFGLSATGDEVVRGIVAVDPRVINLYTDMYVPEYGTGRALDVGGAIKGMRVDLGYSDEYLVYWNNWTVAYLLTPVPPYDQMIWVLPR